MGKKKTIEHYEAEAVRQPNGCLIHSTRVARHVYKLRHGEITKPLLVCHSCDTPACIEDTHHWLGTYKDNSQDASKKGRLRRSIKTRKKMSNSCLGRKNSEEAKEKMRQAKLGKKLTKAHRRKIGLAGIGRPVTKKTRKRIRQAQINRYVRDQVELHIKNKSDQQTCGAKTKRRGGGILPHTCGLSKGHKGKHRCCLQITFPFGHPEKPFDKPIPCNITWGKWGKLS